MYVSLYPYYFILQVIFNVKNTISVHLQCNPTSSMNIIEVTIIKATGFIKIFISPLLFYQYFYTSKSCSFWPAHRTCVNKWEKQKKYMVGLLREKECNSMGKVNGETHFGVNRRENRILMFSIRYHRLISIPFKTKETPLFYEFVVFITRAFFKQFKFLSSCQPYEKMIMPRASEIDRC